ncbi:uncharacterized protein BO87DRAFT_80552 [Aspergillus neoniger CBS 115656]|uniref:Uncharacterized protein n=1 Tax=Aspergillus neoniger (strain CBS 115656) TaxID=1448310 RepID=A0A318Z303_ASPNB|nr:hypothetical protein BO87DRAFT_80552 [Aspergillus neoniger CBS 115656]PYH39303.1 hypothetical protein BO87DRAFT_80552 [Aspergillus neoniger CBS 115656]
MAPALRMTRSIKEKLPVFFCNFYRRLLRGMLFLRSRVWVVEGGGSSRGWICRSFYLTPLLPLFAYGTVGQQH